MSGVKHAFRYILLAFSVLVSGCAKQSAMMSSSDMKALLSQQSDEELLLSIEKLRHQSKDFTLSNDMYRREMVVEFNADQNQISEQQHKLIKLFFQTLPSNDNIKIIISAAPSTNTGFTAINDAWVRIKVLNNLLSTYSEQLEGLYLPSQEIDTVKIQVLGGGSVQ